MSSDTWAGLVVLVCFCCDYGLRLARTLCTEELRQHGLTPPVYVSNEPDISSRLCLRVGPGCRSTYCLSIGFAICCLEYRVLRVFSVRYVISCVCGGIHASCSSRRRIRRPFCVVSFLLVASVVCTRGDWFDTTRGLLITHQPFERQPVLLCVSCVVWCRRSLGTYVRITILFYVGVGIGCVVWSVKRNFGIQDLTQIRCAHSFVPAELPYVSACSNEWGRFAPHMRMYKFFCLPAVNVAS